MRYFIVNYYKKANGQLDEVISVSKRVKMRDLQSASVILDFKTHSVLKSSMEGKVIPKDWERIRGFYHKHYQKIIEDLDKINGQKEVPQSTDTG